MKKAEKYLNSQGKLWLNVASSVYAIKDFVNLDNHILLQFSNRLPFLKKILPSKYHGLIDSYIEAKNTAVMLKHDCRKPLFFEDGTVDHILSSHFLEHVYPDETQRILADFYRALKPGGTIHIIVPDIAGDIKHYLEMKQKGDKNAGDVFMTRTLLSKPSRGTLKYRLLEFHGGFGLQHRWMYDHESMAQKIREAGFIIMDKNDTPSKDYRLNDGSVHIAAKKPG